MNTLEEIYNTLLSLGSSTIMKDQAENQGFFREGEVSWNKGIWVNISSATQEKKTP